MKNNFNNKKEVLLKIFTDCLTNVSKDKVEVTCSYNNRCLDVNVLFKDIIEFKFESKDKDINNIQTLKMYGYTVLLPITLREYIPDGMGFASYGDLKDLDINIDKTALHLLNITQSYNDILSKYRFELPEVDEKTYNIINRLEYSHIIPGNISLHDIDMTSENKLISKWGVHIENIEINKNISTPIDLMNILMFNDKKINNLYNFIKYLFWFTLVDKNSIIVYTINENKYDKYSDVKRRYFDYELYNEKHNLTFKSRRFGVRHHNTGSANDWGFEISFKKDNVEHCILNYFSSHLSDRDKQKIKLGFVTLDHFSIKFLEEFMDSNPNTRACTEVDEKLNTFANVFKSYFNK